MDIVVVLGSCNKLYGYTFFRYNRPNTRILTNIRRKMLISLPKLIISFIIMEATFLGMSSQTALSHAGAAAAIVLAFLLRIAVEWGKNNISGKGIVIQAVCTASICFLAIYVWEEFLSYKKGFEIYVFFASLFSVFIVSEIEIAFKIGFRKRLKMVLTKVLASNEEETQ